ncbi:SDR family NAD(P)-dependent oxidoreductase [candidate division KSB1 bacterium]
MERFTNKSVIVTGGAMGIGKSIAGRFLQEGAEVLIVDYNSDSLDETYEEFRHYRRVYKVCADVSKKRQVEEFVKFSVEKFDGIDILCNNAGVYYKEDFLDITEERWDEILNINLKGMFLVSQTAARVMGKKKRGVIINMSSINGLAGEIEYAHYNASKGGIIMLTKSMAIDLARYNIRVNAVCPGFIKTATNEALYSKEDFQNYAKDCIPMGRVGLSEDVSGVFAFLASDDAAFITGETIVVDGGQLALQ